MPTPDNNARVQEFLTRGVSQILPGADSLKAKMQTDVLKGYMGVDPTGTELHVGHVAQLRRMERFRGLGHQVTLLIGDYTAMIGDPTDKSAARIKLTPEQISINAKTYQEQAARILDFNDPKNPVTLRRNSEWLGKMSGADMLELLSEMSVQRLLERDMFQARMNEGKPLWTHEITYPLLQGLDSVKLDTDVEFGGSDQTFNMMVGRDLVKRHLGKDKWVVAGQLLADPSGKKIGKTEGNMVAVLDAPNLMYEKVMQWGDGITPHALELCTTVPMTDIRELDEALKRGDEDPVKAKMFLARTLVSELHSSEESERAERAFSQLSSGGRIEQMMEMSVTAGTSLIDLLVNSGLASSKSAARRLIQQGGVRVGGQPVTDPTALASEGEIQAGKRTQESFRRVKIKPSES